jgi:hypothetical protein
LSDEELLAKVDKQTDKMFTDFKVPMRSIPALPDDDYDLLIGELILRFKDKIDTKAPQKVKVIEAEGHWYVIPEDLFKKFLEDLNTDWIKDSGEFDIRYGKYMTGGDLNCTQLYAEL